MTTTRTPSPVSMVGMHHQLQVLEARVEALESSVQPTRATAPPTERYDVRADGTVLDHTTGLAWESGEAVKARSALAWQAGMNVPLALGGGWRVPTVAELFAVLDYSRCDPATTLPGARAAWYWSSSSVADDGSNAWYVYFGDGQVCNGGKKSMSYVRCVRREP